MLEAKLCREHIRRRIVDNLSWSSLGDWVIEPLPPLSVPLAPPRLSAKAEATPSQPRRSPVRKFVKRALTSVPFLGRVAVALIVPVLAPLGMATALTARLHNVARRIDELSR